jgi:plasmid stabilization system protein ParE
LGRNIEVYSMKHRLKVFHSKFAERKLRLLLDYIESEWGSKSKSSFFSKYSKSIEQISTHPRSCPESEYKSGLFKCVVTKQTSVLYKINEDSVEIITLFDNRQNQNEVFEEIKNYFA